ncbi:hypothetical protein ACFPRL_31910 [Pseudoclavibacter helvolus]
MASTASSTRSRGTTQPSPRFPGGRCHMSIVKTCPSDMRTPTRPVASSDFEQSRNMTISSPGSTTLSGAFSGSSSSVSVHASSAARTWLYHLRRDSDGVFRGLAIDFAIRPAASSQMASPRTALTTSTTASTVSGAFGGASRESYMRP